MEKLRACEIESACANARRRSYTRLRVAGLGQKSERGAAAESFRLLPDYGRQRGHRARFREIFGKDRARQKQNTAPAGVWSHDRLFAARQERRADIFNRAQGGGASIRDLECETAGPARCRRPRLL